MNITVMRNYRSQLEMILRMELAALEQALETAIGGRRRLVEGADKDLREYVNRPDTTLSADETALQYDVWKQLGEIVRHFDDMIAHARTQRDLKQSEMAEAACEAKKLDVLVKRESRRLRQIERRRDQHALDEVAARRHGHTPQ